MNCTKLSRDGFLKIDDFTIASLMRLKVIPVNSGMSLSSDMGHQKVILSATGDRLGPGMTPLFGTTWLRRDSAFWRGSMARRKRYRADQALTQLANFSHI